jgi:dTDP-4-amino-4,6-dideoxygalactose transaminase
MSNQPAILGNAPIFEKKVNIVRPQLPSMDEMQEGVRSIIETGMVTKGKFLREFEEAIAAHLGVKHAVALSSCTTGLMLSYQGLGLKGDVVVPSFTFMASVSSLVWAGLRPVFADVNAGTTNLSPEAAEAAITPNTSAIVAVHNFGNPAEIDALQAVADRHGLKLIFDSAHGFGARYRGVPVGKQGDAHSFSLSPTKLLIAGEGGIVSTNNDALADHLRKGREYGNDGNYDSAFAGINARMPEFNALLGLKSLQGLEGAAERRNATVALYRREMGKLPGIDFQQVHPEDRNSYREFSILINADAFGVSRDDLATALTAENIDIRKYYDPPVHRQTAYRHFAPDESLLPNTVLLAENSLSFPLWSNIDEETTLGICAAVARIHHQAEEVTKALNQTRNASAV